MATIYFDGDTSYTVPKKHDKMGVACRRIGGPKEYSKDAALARAKELEAQGKRVKAYQYGWKERGFQANEKHCAVVYESPNWWD